jgi:ribosomal protein S21
VIRSIIHRSQPPVLTPHRSPPIADDRLSKDARRIHRPSCLLRLMLPSLTTTIPLLPPCFLRLRTKSPSPPPPPPPPPLQIFIPETNKQPSLELNRRERSILRAKDKTFNVEVTAEEGDSNEECLHWFNREVARTGLWQEWRRRRFYENAREKRKRKQREAALLRRRRYHSFNFSSFLHFFFILCSSI